VIQKTKQSILKSTNFCLFAHLNLFRYPVSHSLKSTKTRGFTIIELLVVIVVIAILAAISLVSYTGIRERAIVATLQSDLKNASTQLEMDKANNGTYPTTKEAANNNQGLISSSGNTFDYNYSSTNDTYELIATNDTVSYSITSEDQTPTLAESSPADVSFALAWIGEIDNYDQAYSLVQTSDGTLSWSRTWGGTLWDYAYSLVQTGDGGYAIAGSTDSYGAGSGDAFIAKFTSDGTLSWNKTWGGTGSDRLNSLIQTSDDGYAMAGSTNSYGVGYSDAFLTKFKSDGTIANCSAPMCQSPTATATNLSVTIDSPTAIVTSPSAISTVIVAP
jgi:prepilin-type N-terminal cleavage/methylation domain-containing protein